MKANIKQTIDSIIRDNRAYIESYTNNISDYLIVDFANEDQGHCMYLTDEEIELWEKDEDEKVRLINQINDLINEYNIETEEYFTESKNDRIFNLLSNIPNTIELHEGYPGQWVNEDGDLVGISAICKRNGIEGRYHQISKIDCSVSEQDDDLEIINALNMLKLSECYKIKVILNMLDTCGNEQYYYFVIG